MWKVKNNNELHNNEVSALEKLVEEINAFSFLLIGNRAYKVNMDFSFAMQM